jgi:hypothetical protein
MVGTEERLPIERGWGDLGAISGEELRAIGLLNKVHYTI